MNDNDPLDVRLAHLGGVAVLMLSGQIDTVTAPRFHESLQRVCELGVPVVLDMGLVTFMDSSGISALVDACGVTRALPNAVQIHRPSDQVRRLLSLTGLDDIFVVEP